MSPTAAPARPVSSLHELDERTKKRNAAEARCRMYGMVAVGLGLLFLILLLTTIISNGTRAFTQTFLAMEITVTQEELEKAEASFVKTSKYRDMITGARAQKVADGGYETELTSAKDLTQLLSAGAAIPARALHGQPWEAGTPVEFQLLTASRWMDT